MRLFPVRTGLLAIGLLCFCLPFVRISCNSQPFAEVTGIEYSIGRQVPALDFAKTITSDSLERMMAPMAEDARSDENAKPGEKKEKEKIDIQWEALSALCLVFFAFLLGFLVRTRTGIILSSASAFLASVALGILHLNLNHAPDTGMMGIEIKHEMLIGYWLALLLPLVAAITGGIELARTQPVPLAATPAEPVEPIAPTAFVEGIEGPPADPEPGSGEKSKEE